MKILMCKNPWILNGDPPLGTNWGGLKLEEFIQSFDHKKYTFHVCVGDSAVQSSTLTRITKKPNCEVSAILQKDLSNIFPNYIDHFKKSYKGSHTKEECSKIEKLFQEKLNNFHPDIIISFGAFEVPELRNLFPNTPIFLQELSTFNAPIYPKSWYLDICGAHNNSFISIFHKEILNIRIEDKKKEEFLSPIREVYCGAIIKANPINRKDLDPKNKFKYIVFLPLESSMYPNFFNHANFINQFDLITYILDRLDPDIGLVIKDHVTTGKSKKLTKTAIKYLKKTYSNFIYLDHLKHSRMGSYFLLSLSDASISISSTMGMQSLLWRKPLFVIGDMYTKHYSDGNKIEDIRSVLEKDYQDKDDVLYYLLNNYYIPHEKFIDSEWMEKFMNRAIEKHKNLGFDFYEPVDTPENTLLYYASTANMGLWFMVHQKLDLIIKYLPIFADFKPLIIQALKSIQNSLPFRRPT